MIATHSGGTIGSHEPGLVGMGAGCGAVAGGGNALGIAPPTGAGLSGGFSGLFSLTGLASAATGVGLNSVGSLMSADAGGVALLDFLGVSSFLRADVEAPAVED